MKMVSFSGDMSQIVEIYAISQCLTILRNIPGSRSEENDFQNLIALLWYNFHKDSFSIF